MATAPDAILGLVRTYDLLSSLISDVHYNYEALHQDESSQPSRRNVVRSTFSFIEGMIQILKFELIADFRLGRTSKTLTNKESEVLYEVKIREDEKIPWNVPLDVNLKKTISIATKVWSLDKDVFNLSSESYNTFLKAKITRNLLTHLRTFYDIEISEQEVTQMAITFKWIKDGFVSIMKNKTELSLKTLPEEVANDIRKQYFKN
jgi:hypothetical protein